MVSRGNLMVSHGNLIESIRNIECFILNTDLSQKVLYYAVFRDLCADGKSPFQLFLNPSQLFLIFLRGESLYTCEYTELIRIFWQLIIYLV